MRAAGSDLSVTVWKPLSILILAPVFLIPFAILLFIPGWRVLGAFLLIPALIQLPRQIVAVQVSTVDVAVRSLFTTRHYPLREIREVEFRDQEAAFGATTPAVVLHMRHGDPVKISGFMIEKTDDLYKAIKAAWEHAQTSEEV